MKIINLSHLLCKVCFTLLLTGCAEIATSVAINSGVQYAGERYLIAHQSPVIKCHVFNVMKGNKMCRVSMVYMVKYKTRKKA